MIALKRVHLLPHPFLGFFRDISKALVLSREKE